MKRALWMSLAVALCACGDDVGASDEGGQDGDAGELDVDVPAVEDVSWAVGWWRDPAEETSVPEGLILRQLEVRENGDVFQQVLNCFTEDAVYMGRWVPAAYDRIYVVGSDDGDEVEWMGAGAYRRVELRYDEANETVEVTRIGENSDGSDRELPAGEFRQGRKCMTDVVVSDCAPRACDASE
ncbi:MAG: hypothetical protein ACRBN8_28970 [Nannocystales bacterium]